MSELVPYKMSDLKDRMTYKEVMRHCKDLDSKMHLGQLKLLLSEILFLAKTSKGDEIVVYAGAAEGYHIYMLAKLFPTLKFELWDSRAYDLEDHPHIQKNRGLFTNDLAAKYAERRKNGEKFLFMSDIRNLEFGRYQKDKHSDNGEKLDEIVEDDIQMQMDWCRIMKPRWAYLKFRLPYQEGKTNYLTGKIYLQPYSPISTETRLLTNDYTTIKTYDNTENDEMMAYFNCHIRFEPLKDNRWDEIMEKNAIKKNWDNYISFYILAYYLERESGEVPSDNDVLKLFDDIVNYHRKKYGNKYDVLYED